jgi:drug/metabolite transporter (DMT)-like permease
MLGYQLLLNWAEVTTPAGTSSLVASASPLVSAVIAVLFFNERLSKVRVLGLVIAVAGITAVCLTESHFSPSVGLLIVVGAMFFYGAYHPLVHPLYSEYSSIEVATYCLIASGLMSLPLIPFAWHGISTAGSTPILSAVYLGVIPSALAFVLWGYVLSRLPVTTSTSLIVLIPAVAIGISFFWLGEIPLPSEVGGGAVVFVGVALSTGGDDIVSLLDARRHRVAALRQIH